jgi:hypothetical protein
MTDRVMRRIAADRALGQMNDLQRRIARLWLAGHTPAEISRRMDLPAWMVTGWIATTEILTGIELDKLRTTYRSAYGRHGWPEM